tara:strand:+ start:12002 stop:12772 length:771 start_codon:yes stop_codon:yes gene_type:complete
MINKKYLKLQRSNNSYHTNNFIYTIIAKRIIDSLDLLNINVNHILEIGVNENITFDYIRNRFNLSTIDRSDFYLSQNWNKKNFFELKEDFKNLKKNCYNIIYSNTFLHLTNNIDNNLRNIFESLKSNGFFIAAIPDKESMYQLTNSMYEADISIYNGAYQRVNPTFEINHVLNSLKKINFDSPSIYSDIITIEYEEFEKLLTDIKNMRLSYCYKDKKKNFENKRYFKILEKFYRKNYFNKQFNLDIKTNIISAWKK